PQAQVHGAGRFRGGARGRRSGGRAPSRTFVMQNARPIRPASRVPAWPPGRSLSGGEPVRLAAGTAGLVPEVRFADGRCRMTAAAGGVRGEGSSRGAGTRQAGREAGPLAAGAGQVTTASLVAGAGLVAGGRAWPAVDAVVERLDAERVPGAEQFPGPGV